MDRHVGADLQPAEPPAPCGGLAAPCPPRETGGTPCLPGRSAAAHPAAHPPGGGRAAPFRNAGHWPMYCPAKGPVIAESAAWEGEFRPARTGLPRPGPKRPRDRREVTRKRGKLCGKHRNKPGALLKGSLRFCSAPPRPAAGRTRGRGRGEGGGLSWPRTTLGPTVSEEGPWPASVVAEGWRCRPGRARRPGWARRPGRAGGRGGGGVRDGHGAAVAPLRRRAHGRHPGGAAGRRDRAGG